MLCGFDNVTRIGLTIVNVELAAFERTLSCHLGDQFHLRYLANNLLEHVDEQLHHHGHLAEAKLILVNYNYINGQYSLGYKLLTLSSIDNQVLYLEHHQWLEVHIAFVDECTRLTFPSQSTFFKTLQEV